MTTITISRNKIKIRGHAGYAPCGHDIVCAGLTALVQTLIGSLKKLTKDNITYEISPGRADIYFEDLTKEGKLLVKSFLIGVRYIADEFGDYVKIN